VVSRLTNPELRGAFTDEIRRDQEGARASHRGPRTQKLISLEEARKRKPVSDWKTVDIPKPSFTGVRTWDPVALEDIVPYIDWTPFFHVWELKGTYPRILEAPGVGDKARELLDDAQGLLKQIVAIDRAVRQVVVE